MIKPFEHLTDEDKLRAILKFLQDFCSDEKIESSFQSMGIRADIFQIEEALEIMIEEKEFL